MEREGHTSIEPGIYFGGHCTFLIVYPPTIAGETTIVAHWADDYFQRNNEPVNPSSTPVDMRAICDGFFTELVDSELPEDDMVTKVNQKVFIVDSQFTIDFGSQQDVRCRLVSMAPETAYFREVSIPEFSMFVSTSHDRDGLYQLVAHWPTSQR